MIVVAATQNEHKLQEMRAILHHFGMELISQAQAGLETVEIEETGDTFEENSLIKARAIMKLCGKTCIADDSGLSVEALMGAPGVFSARFSGPDATDEKNNEKLLNLMANETNRKAKFVCVITLIYPNEKTIVGRGECNGKILLKPQGTYGFGYDPLFLPDGYHMSFGEMVGDEKNRISHRAKALSSMAGLLEKEKR